MKKYKDTSADELHAAAAAHGHSNGSQAPAGPRIPSGQCPLCMTVNPYTIGVCTSCGLPLPWADAVMPLPDPLGACQRCGAENSFNELRCRACRTMLPWANAVKTARQKMEADAIASVSHYDPGFDQDTFAPAPTKSRPRPPTDEERAVEIISMIIPPLGFAAHVILLPRNPDMASNTARNAAYGMCGWGGMIILWFLFSIAMGHLHSPSIAVPNNWHASTSTSAK